MLKDVNIICFCAPSTKYRMYIIRKITEEKLRRKKWLVPVTSTGTGYYPKWLVAVTLKASGKKTRCQWQIGNQGF